MNIRDGTPATPECEAAPGLGSRFSTDEWAGGAEREALGQPLTIHEVAELLGCSPWTVRQRYLRQGLPHLQARARGKLVFFREQVIVWIEKRQRQKGGFSR
jgi:hypothetical protein